LRPYVSPWYVLYKGASSTAAVAAGTALATWGCGEAAFGGSARPWQGLGGSMAGAFSGIVVGASAVLVVELLMRSDLGYLRSSLLAGFAAAGADLGYQLARGRR
jgi:hypothetical protein